MGISCTICLILLVIASCCFYRQLGLQGGPLWMTVIIPLVSTVNLEGALEIYALYAVHYFSILISVFIMLGFHKKQRAYIFFAFLFAILLGYQGMRGVLMLFLPLLATEVLRVIVFRYKGKKVSLIRGGALLAATILSYLTAALTHSGMTETTRNLRHAPEKFINEVVPAIERLLMPWVNPVYTTCTVLILVAGIACPVIVLLSRPEETESDAAWAIMPLIASFLVMVAAMTFTTTEVAARYAVMLFFAAAGGYGLLMQRLHRTEMRQEWVRYAAAIPVLVCTIISLRYNWNNLIAADTSGRDAHARIADMMVQKGVTKGYTTFDWANTITVVSNGEVQVCPVTNMADLEATKWLSDAGWYPPYTDAEREVFYITSRFHDAEFREAISQRNINVLEEIAVDDYTMYLTDRDYTRLVEE